MFLLLERTVEFRTMKKYVIDILNLTEFWIHNQT
jgi:hypothetical protein